jgi:hypothetical protein
MLTGSLPEQEVDERVPEKYRFFIRKSTEWKREDRYQSVSEMRDAFEMVKIGLVEPRPVREQALQLVDDWMHLGLSVGEDLPRLQALHRLLSEHSSDRTLFLTIVPRLPRPLLRQYADVLPDEFRMMLDVFEGHVSDVSDPDLCGSVVEFFRDVWMLSERVDVRKDAMAGLVAGGHRCGANSAVDLTVNVFGDIKSEIEIRLAVEVLSENPSASEWLRGNSDLASRRLAPALEAVIFGPDRDA